MTRVLLSAATPGGDAADVLVRLRRAGYGVDTCRGGDRCALASGGACPLADHFAGVLVHVRERTGPPAGRDRPFLCAVLAGVPAVLCGPASPEGPWSRADATCDPDEVADAVRTVLSRTGAGGSRR